MTSFFMPLLFGMGQQAAQAGAEPAKWYSSILSFLPFIAIILIFYLLIIRPQNKKQKETQKMLAALKKGDKVVTIGGIHGVIQSVRESTVILKVDDGTKIEFSRSAISSITTVSKEKDDDDDDSSDAKEISDK